jgi:hypothetical protein
MLLFRALQNGPVLVRRMTAVAASTTTTTTTLLSTPRATSKMAFLSTAAASAAAAAKKSSTAAAAAAAVVGGQWLSKLTQENPHINVVRYHYKNRVWTLQHVEYYSEALAIGLVETGLKQGDAVLSWLPQHFAEQVRLYTTSCYIGV